MKTSPTRRAFGSAGFGTRRNFLRSAAAGSILFPGIVETLLADSGDPLAPRLPHFSARAKNVIFLFMTGGASQI